MEIESAESIEPILITLLYVEEGLYAKGRGITFTFEVNGTGLNAYCIFNLQKQKKTKKPCVTKNSSLGRLFIKLGSQEPPSRYMRFAKRLVGKSFLANVEYWEEKHEIKLKKQSLRLFEGDENELFYHENRQDIGWQKFGSIVSAVWQELGKSVAEARQNDGSSVADAVAVDSEADTSEDPENTDDMPYSESSLSTGEKSTDTGRRTKDKGLRITDRG